MLSIYVKLKLNDIELIAYQISRQKKYLEIISMNNEDRVTLFCSFYDTPSGGECQVILQMIKRKYHFI